MLSVGGDPLLDGLHLGVSKSTGNVDETMAIAAKFRPRFPSIVAVVPRLTRRVIVQPHKIS